MAKSKQIVCKACGHKNKQPLSKTGCASCGAGGKGSGEPREAPYHHKGFSIIWLLIALVVTSVLTAAIIIGLPMVVHSLDFEGSAGIVLAIPVWFCSGVLVGLISPEKTFTEPALAASIIAVPTVIFLVKSQTVKTMPLFMYLLMAALGVLFALVGSYAGERLQMGPSRVR